MVGRAGKPAAHLRPNLEQLACIWPACNGVRPGNHLRKLGRGLPSDHVEALGLFDERCSPLADVFEELGERRETWAAAFTDEHSLVSLQTTAPEADSRLQVARPDPGIQAHPARDVRDVRAHELAHVGDFVDEADARSEEGVRRELDHLRGGDVGAHDGCVESCVQPLDRVPRRIPRKRRRRSDRARGSPSAPFLLRGTRGSTRSRRSRARARSSSARTFLRPDRDGALHHQDMRSAVRAAPRSPSKRATGRRRRSTSGGVDAHEDEVGPPTASATSSVK